MKLKVYVIDLEIPARTKRRALLVGIPLGILMAGAGIVYATVPNVFAVGDPLSSAKVNANFSSLDTRTTALEAAPYVWSWQYTGSNVTPSANKVASITFTPPAAGFALVTAHYGNVILNGNGAAGETDCHVATQVSLTGGLLPDPGQPGYRDVYINGNLPTQFAGGTYLDFNQSASVVIPVTAASTTVYLNGQVNAGTTGCQAALWRTITFDAIYFKNNPTATGATY